MDKIYIWSWKQGKFGVSISFWPKDLELLKANVNEKGWIKLDLNERKEADKFGNTHYLTVNTWKPDVKSTSVEEAKKVFSDEDVPF